MIFCSECFRNPEIKSIIEKCGKNGSCPVCGNSNTVIYDTTTNSELIGFFDNLLSVYTAEKDLQKNYPKSDLRSLADAIKNEWDIFSDLSDECILEILKELSPVMREDYSSIFEDLVGIDEKYDICYLKEHSILHTKKWEDFVESIKHINRFHSNLIDKDLLTKYCLNISRTIPMGKKRFYRGRISADSNGFTPSEMGPPPKGKATAGRANAIGISRLYLTDNRITTYHEIRAAEYDYVSIGTFKLQRDIKVVDLRLIDKISPFGEDIDCTALAVNRDHLLKINQEMSRPMRRGDSQLDYLPTQYICDLIMSIVDDDGNSIFDGIMYQSTMHSQGANLAIFYPDCLKCTYSSTYEVKKLHYSTNKIAKTK